MSRQVFLFVVVLLSFAFLLEVAGPQKAYAQDSAAKKPPGWTITVDPLTTSLGFVNLQFERRISNHFSAYMGPNLRLYDNIFSSETEPYRGYGAEGGMRFFPFGKAPSGLWFMARGVGARTVLLSVDDLRQAWAGYASGLVGFTWIPWNWLVLSGGGGVQYFRYGIAEYGIRGIAPALHTTVGIAF